ncbi:hypothetical protein FOXYSP1_11816 [Fusarium oxysporum f. sp. phaseoli]
MCDAEYRHVVLCLGSNLVQSGRQALDQGTQRFWCELSSIKRPSSSLLDSKSSSTLISISNSILNTFKHFTHSQNQLFQLNSIQNAVHQDRLRPRHGRRCHRCSRSRQLRDRASHWRWQQKPARLLCSEPAGLLHRSQLCRPGSRRLLDQLFLLQD